MHGIKLVSSCLFDPFTPPTDTTTLQVARYLLIKTLVAWQLLTSTHMHTHTHTHTHTLQHTCTCEHTHTHTHKGAHTHTHTHKHVRTHARTHTHRLTTETRPAHMYLEITNAWKVLWLGSQDCAMHAMPINWFHANRNSLGC